MTMEINNYFSSQDVGNIICLEHLNLSQPDQIVAMVFYIEGLGLTRDPYAPNNTGTVWINIGIQQIHIPKIDNPQVFSGHIGLVIPSIAQLVENLRNVQNHPALVGTKFSWKIKDTFTKGLVPPEYNNKVVHVQCPWGNKFRIYEAQKSFGTTNLGILYLLHHCEITTVELIAKFYQNHFEVPVYFETEHKKVHVVVGPWQRLIFKEKKNYKRSDYSGYHVAIYVSKFSNTYNNFAVKNLLFTKHRFADKCDTLQDALHWQQFRTLDFVNEQNKEVVLYLEHEVRSLYHPSFKRPLVNRLGNVGIFCNQ